MGGCLIAGLPHWYSKQIDHRVSSLMNQHCKVSGIAIKYCFFLEALPRP